MLRFEFSPLGAVWLHVIVDPNQYNLTCCNCNKSCIFINVQCTKVLFDVVAVRVCTFVEA